MIFQLLVGKWIVYLYYRALGGVTIFLLIKVNKKLLPEEAV